jgi:hypothetical protein
MEQDSAQKLSVEKMTKKNDLTGRFALGGLGETRTRDQRIKSGKLWFFTFVNQ